MSDWTRPADLSSCSDDVRAEIQRIRDLANRRLTGPEMASVAERGRRAVEKAPEKWRKLTHPNRHLGSRKPKVSDQEMAAQRVCKLGRCDAVLIRRPDESRRQFVGRGFCSQAHGSEYRRNPVKAARCIELWAAGLSRFEISRQLTGKHSTTQVDRLLLRAGIGPEQWNERTREMMAAKAAAVTVRHDKIRELAAQNWSTKDIGAEMRMHSASVAKIISGAAR